MAPPQIIQTAAAAAVAAGTADVIVSLDSPADPDHSVVIVYETNTAVSTVPAGFGLDYNPSASPPLNWWRLDRTVGGEQSFTVTNIAAGGPSLWAVFETTLLDQISPVDEVAVTAAFHPATSVSTLSSGTTAGATGTVDTLTLAVHYFQNANGSNTTHAWSGHTNGFVEYRDVGLRAGTAYYGMSVSALDGTGVVGPFSTTATLSTDGARSATNDLFLGSIISYQGPVFEEAPPGIFAPTPTGG